jgi:hypothetical protein
VIAKLFRVAGMLAVIAGLAVVPVGAAPTSSQSIACEAPPRLAALQDGEPMFPTPTLGVAPICALETERGLIAIILAVANNDSVPQRVLGTVRLSDGGGNTSASLATTDPTGYAVIHQVISQSPWPDLLGMPISAEDASIGARERALVLLVFEVRPEATGLRLVP